MRLCRSWAALLLGGALVLPGPTTTSRAVDQINGMSTQPLPTTPPRAVMRPDMIWVPDRYLRVPGEAGMARVPGHWEQVLSPHEVYVPPLVVDGPGHRSQTVPAGVRPPTDERPNVP
ncbi:MAG TPA: hypothetical protein VGU22_19435 [Methylomirabilota bacterium]|nr:hypothetical protein [Methylomirabilota bacterium]